MKQILYDIMAIIGMLTIFAASIIFTACQKDDEQPACISATPEEHDLCEPIPTWQGQGLRPGIVDTTNITYPVVNPNNPNEFIFHFNREGKVYKLNVTTGEKNVVVENGWGYGPDPADWGINDWLLFTRMQNLYKVKSNGDSLTQITFNGMGVRGRWNPGGDKYTYLTATSQGPRRVIANMQDVVIDTLPSALNVPVAWAAEDTFFFHRGMYVMGADSITMLYDMPTTGGSSIVALSSSEFIDFTNEVIRVNTLTGEVSVTPGPGSDCKRYLGIDYSPQKQKLLSQERYRRLMPNGIHEYIRRQMVWLNLDGTVHEAIDISPFFNE